MDVGDEVGTGFNVLLRVELGIGLTVVPAAGIPAAVLVAITGEGNPVAVGVQPYNPNVIRITPAKNNRAFL